MKEKIKTTNVTRLKPVARQHKNHRMVLKKKPILITQLQLQTNNKSSLKKINKNKAKTNLLPKTREKKAK